jgi:hypothetical protein
MITVFSHTLEVQPQLAACFHRTIMCSQHRCHLFCIISTVFVHWKSDDNLFHLVSFEAVQNLLIIIFFNFAIASECIQIDTGQKHSH